LMAAIPSIHCSWRIFPIFAVICDLPPRLLLRTVGIWRSGH
jgi:hypothetical protein